MHTYGNTEALIRALTEPRRNHFFYGKRMDVQHFEMEQQYGKLKQWLLNRLTLGKGVLCGLRVSLDGQRVCVDPGVAIDGWGREIIVPVRTCIDPLAVDTGCCGHHPQASTITPSRPAGNPDTHNHLGGTTNPAHHEPSTSVPASSEHPKNGVFTLWVCYHECLADYQPVLVSDCQTRDHCAAGTVVESFCLKTTPGLPPLQGDPDWCAELWKKKPTLTEDADHSDDTVGMMAHMNVGPLHNTNALDPGQVDAGTVQKARLSRRYALCTIFDDTCEPPEGDPCVPLAIVVIRDGTLSLENCLARPRIYSNARLLDLILCLSDKIDECCNGHETAELMRVRSIEFLSRRNGGEAIVASVQSPLQDTLINIERHVNAIRIRFTKPFATNQHIPTTHGLKEADYKIHNVQVLPEKPIKNLLYVPGTLAIETSDTIRFDLLPGSPYILGGEGSGWQKGRYRIFLRGTEQLSENRQALTDTSNHAFDGEPIVPTGGMLSGNGAEGGDFNAHFVIGAGR